MMICSVRIQRSWGSPKLTHQNRGHQPRAWQRAVPPPKGLAPIETHNLPSIFAHQPDLCDLRCNFPPREPRFSIHPPPTSRQPEFPPPRQRFYCHHRFVAPLLPSIGSRRICPCVSVPVRFANLVVPLEQPRWAPSSMSRSCRRRSSPM